MATKALTSSIESVGLLSDWVPTFSKRPLKILDPGRSKLTTVETKRIISVLDDAIIKVELVTMFSYIMENLEACRAVRDTAFARSPTADVLLRGLLGLRRFLFEMLLTTPLEEKEKMKFMKEIALRDMKNMEAIAALEDELASAIHNRDEEISRKNGAIKDLKAHLHTAEGSSSSPHIAENREMEYALRKKKYKVETEIENWIQKYDIEMIEKQEELEEINVVYKVEKAQLEELRAKFAILNEEYSQIEEERLQKQEEREKAEKELAILARAATLIQALWKGYLVRSLLRTKRRKKGRGKKAKK
uniref:Uncharacterized protein n=1 Tax=Sphaerodactylus townsendi TaxID=933632 RepID=A0ACB8FY43_9SAUR